jgi:methionyl-tRNA formyltransferase
MTRIAFLGSHRCSFQCLEYLLTRVEGAMVISVTPHVDQPPIGPEEDVRTLASSNGIPVVERESLPQLDFDLGISLLFDRVLPPAVFSRPSRGFANIHLAPLPRFRGANGALHALRLAHRDNHWQFGVTMHYIDEGVDTGPIVDEIAIPILETDTAASLHARSCDQVLPLFSRNIHRLVATPGRVPARPQSGLSYFFKRGQVDHEVDLSLPPDEIYDQVRALTFPGRPRPYAMIGRRRIYLSIEP